MSQGSRGVCLALLFAFAGCSGSGTAPNPTVDGGSGCQPCPSGEGCDTSTRTCVPAAAAGSYCGASVTDGGLALCVDGTTCGPVADGANVCAKPCASSTDCGSGEACFANPSTVAARQYCADEVALGSGCSIDHLQECAAGSNGEVVECLGSDEAGTCVARCMTTSDCPSGKNCSAPFSDGAGVCVTPTIDGSPCDESNASDYVLCSAGQVCVLESSGMGTCHTACGVDAGSCASPEVCAVVDPCQDVDGFCVTPAAEGASCSEAQGQYCGPSDDCVGIGTGFTCELDCTQGEACPSGTSCQPLPATDGGFICRKACF